jgi:hypothetical protein
VGASIRKLGEYRRSTKRYGTGLYALHGSETEVIEVTGEGWLTHVEQFAYLYPSLQQNPGWQSRGYEVAQEPPRAELERPAPVRLSWWSRLFGRRRIPEARLLCRSEP